MRKVILALLVSISFSFCVNAQKTVEGKVTDANGKPISNASVVIKGTKIGTTTGADGTYSIQVPANGKVIEFSSLNFESQSVTIGTKTNISATLSASGSSDLGEVVVTGISKVKKSQFAGATTKIDEKQLKNQPVGSFDQILQGRAPGISALTASGAPGSPTNVIIRGQGSIQGGTDPLYIVDGIPVESGVFQGFNPNDFASIDVLRDAASTALYGSRGSAGVIVVTTKRGQAGKLKLGYSAQMGIKQRPQFPFKPMNTAQLLKAHEQYGRILSEGNPLAPEINDSISLQGFYYSPLNPRYANLSDEEKAWAASRLATLNGINTNWTDQIYKTGNFSNHQLTLSGGTGKTRILSSLALYNEEGTTLRTDMKRITARNNIDFADDKFSLSVSSNLAYTKRNFQQSTQTNSLSNPFLSSALTVPFSPVFNSDGTYATGVGQPRSVFNSFQYAGAKQLEVTEYDRNYNDQLKATLGITLGYKLNENISFGVTAGTDFRETQNSNYVSKIPASRSYPKTFPAPFTPPPTSTEGAQTEGLSRFFRGTVRPSATYRNSFNEKHDVEFTVLSEYVREFNKSFSATGFGTDPKRPNTMAVIVPANAVNQLFHSTSGGKSENSLVSGLANARYTYDGKYTLTASYRRDGSSKLPVDTRWQGFYSVGAIWDATKEDFIKDIKFINMLRVKLNYGGSGNADNFPGGNYPYQEGFVVGNYAGISTIFKSALENTDLKWEATYVTNFGIDFELLNRRLYGDINLYDKRTKDLFISRTLSASSGFGSQEINAGVLGNKGVEVSLNGEVYRSKDFNVTLFANVGYNKNEVLSLGGENSYEVGTELITEGLPLGSHFEVKWAGVDASTGQELYYDKNGKIVNVYNANDAVQQFGTWEAPWRGGFGANVRYKSFDLSVLFSWQSGATKFDNLEFFVQNPAFLGSGFNQSSELQFWQQPGDVVNSASPLYQTNFSSKFIHDASFLRFRDLKVGYTLPKSMLSKTKFISSANLFLQGNNLFIWTKWRGPDPEAGGQNINLSEFPNPMSMTAGLDINF
jgi:TonB-linked SusC/RagA family outer membrane protein